MRPPDNSEWLSSTIEAVITKEAEQGFEALTPLQRIVFVVADIDTTVAMEGLFGYYDCLAGSNAIEAAEALEIIGARESAGLMRLANAQFPGQVLPLEQEARRKALWSLDGAAAETIERLGRRFMECPDDLDTKLEDFMLAERDKGTI